MVYTDNEVAIMSLIDRTNFQHLSKNDFLHFASKLNELRPEVAAQVLAQFPELTRMIISETADYKQFLGKIIECDNESTNSVFSIIEQVIANSESGKHSLQQLAQQVLDELNQSLSSTEMPPEERMDARQKAIKVLEMMQEENRRADEHQRVLAQMAADKDAESKDLKWKIVCFASGLCSFGFAVALAALGGNFNLKLPKRSS